MRREPSHHGGSKGAGRVEVTRRAPLADASRASSSTYTIGKLAALTKVSADTLRYYEREGLMIGPVERASSTLC